jgi:predicted DNA-binding protein (MmcQ/YjbR family)
MKQTATEKLRGICLAFPEAEEQEFGGHTKPTWRVRGKIFAMMSEDAEDVTFKAAPGAQAILVEAHPGSYYVPRYVGSKGWIGVHADHKDIDWEELRGLLFESYQLIAPKSVLKAAGLA